MQTRADGWERLGALGALAVAGFGLLRLAGLVALVGDRRSATAMASVIVAAGGAALAQGLAVEGARRRLGPSSRLIWTACVAGWAGAALTAAPMVLVARAMAEHDGDVLRRGLLVGWLAAFATALWVAGVSAADWRRHAFPPWLRVAGATFAVLSLAAAVLPPLGALAAPVALAWWLALGVVLLRPRSTPG